MDSSVRSSWLDTRVEIDPPLLDHIAASAAVLLDDEDIPGSASANPAPPSNESVEVFMTIVVRDDLSVVEVSKPPRPERESTDSLIFTEVEQLCGFSISSESVIIFDVCITLVNESVMMG